MSDKPTARDVIERALTTSLRSPGARTVAADLIISALNSAGLSPPDWQPIETAPKDGTKILGFEPHPTITPKEPTFRCVCMRWNDTKWRGHGRPTFAWVTAESGSLVYDPTHWMPLPSPPKEK